MTIDRRAALRYLGTALCAATVGLTSGCAHATGPAPSEPAAPRSTPSAPTPTTAPPAPPEPLPEGLPLAVHDAVISALLVGPDAVSTHIGFLEHDLALHERPGGEPIAVLPARNFLREPSTLAVVRTAGDWSLVLTPARKTLPSSAGPGGAPAQTAAWARTVDLPPLRPTTSSVTIRVAEQTMTITTPEYSHRHEVGVGQDETPTPSGVSGYLQARYVDPAQALAPGAIHLTSLHATTVDEPYTGTDGGLIAVHASPDPRGRSSHGCVRVQPAVVAELDGLPLGTPVVVLP